MSPSQEVLCPISSQPDSTTRSPPLQPAIQATNPKMPMPQPRPPRPRRASFTHAKPVSASGTVLKSAQSHNRKERRRKTPVLCNGSLHTWTTVKLPSWMDGAQIARAYHVVMPPVSISAHVELEEMALIIVWNSGQDRRTRATQAHATSTSTAQREAKRPQSAVAFSTFSLIRNGAEMSVCDGEKAMVSRGRMAIRSAAPRWQMSTEPRVSCMGLLCR